MQWLRRYDDPTPPTAGEAVRGVLLRAGLPLLGLIAVNLAIGWVIAGPLGGWTAESAVNGALQDGRSPALDAAALFFSTLGSTVGNIVGCVLAVGLLWWATRRWWVAILPAVALVLEAITHAAVSTVVNRERPEVEQLDAAQPTASFPSGHVGATTAQLVVLFLLALGVPSRAVRWAVGVAVAVLVGGLMWSRLYLGMHHVSDVVVGLANGVACGVLAWGYLPRGDGINEGRSS